MAKEKHGAQFLIIALGDKKVPCEDDDSEAAAEWITSKVPLQVNILRGNTADLLTELLAHQHQLGLLSKDIAKYNEQ